MLPTRVQERRNRLREMLERQDMMNRRVQLDIPEFYVGSIIAVTCSGTFISTRLCLGILE
jgi:large subunit ribosomal protein L19